MARFYPLTVTDVRKTIRDAVVVSLTPQNGGNFDFIQGQYLTFRQDFDGTELRRSYSICAGKDDGILQVGIKKVAGGAFSTWANETLVPGMQIDALEPAGTFHSPLDGRIAKTYLAFAGGSGITPILSILKTTLAAEPLSRFTLVFANRGVNTIMFREELEDLKNSYIGRLTIIHILEGDGQDIPLFQGRVDGAKCAALFAGWIDIENVDTAFICGPEPMMMAIVAALKDHGLDADQIKYELFAAGQGGRLERPVTAASDAMSSATKATITLDGTTRRFDIPKDMTVLDAALGETIDAPFACKAGVCSTCRCKVIKGAVEMVANHALEDHEVKDGFILACQSFALTNELVIDYDQH